MQRRRFKQTTSLEARLAEEANRLREEARSLPPGAEREEMLRKARQAETGSHMTEWLTSPDFARQNKSVVRDMEAHVEKLRADAAECALIRDLATDPQKRALFTRLAKHLSTLAREVETAIAAKLTDPE